MPSWLDNFITLKSVGSKLKLEVARELYIEEVVTVCLLLAELLCYNI